MSKQLQSSPTSIVNRVGMLNTPSLCDILVEVPHLLASCLSQTGIKQLRPVCKELNVVASQAATSVSIKLGDREEVPGGVHAQLTPQLMKRLNLATLGTMHVSIATTSDRCGPSLLRQLSTVILQWKNVAQHMGNAIKSVKHLTVDFLHRPPDSKHTKNESSGEYLKPIKERSFMVLSHIICKMLAAADPYLVSLVVVGCCADAALACFGASCPRLSILQLEAIWVSVWVLEDVGRNLPGLTTFILRPPPPMAPHMLPGQLDRYLGACLQALQACPLLRNLDLDFTRRNLDWESDPGTWLHVPKGILNLTYLCKGGSMRRCPALVRRLQQLTISSSSSADVLHLVRLAPDLRVISTGADIQLDCDEEHVLVNIALLQQRMVSGSLSLDAHAFRLEGTSKNLQAVLEALPPLTSQHTAETRCKLLTSTPPGLHCLGHVPRVFPGLTSFRLEGDFLEPLDPRIDQAVLEPLALCTSLTGFNLRIPVAHTTSALAELCRSMPYLLVLGFLPCQGVDIVQLQTLLDDHVRATQLGQVTVISWASRFYQ